MWPGTDEREVNGKYESRKEIQKIKRVWSIWAVYGLNA